MGLKRGQIEFEIEREEIRRRRFKRLHRANIRGQLKQMIGKSAEFRGLQEAIIRTVVRGDGPIMQITPTGGGKSSTFMLPAFCTPDGMTIVVTPLVALENDMEDRCRKMGIDGYVWKSRGVQRGVSLVFVTPESAVTKGFRSFVERMHGQEKLDRVVVDECHTVLEWTKTFRPRIGQLGSALQEFGLQVICLTATLKKTEERLLYAQLGFEAERVRLFRERTTRRNIEYRVEIVEDREGEGVGRSGQRAAREGARRWKQNGSAARNSKDREEDEVMERVCEVVKMWTEANHNEGKVVIYGGTIERVRKIAALLDCVGYWNKAGSAEDKARWMEEWRTSVGGKSGWIVATNALGLGVDVPDVRLVVHAEMPRRLRDFVQESGRGGRDGKRSESVVVVRSSWMKEQQGIWTKRREERDRGGDNGVSEEGTVSKQAYEWEEDVVEFVEGKECRREVLDREMDGFMGRVGCEVGEEERCDVCRERALRMETQASRGDISRVSVQSEEEEELARAAAAVEADYERSKRSIQWAEVEQVARVMKEVEDAADFEAELDDWSGRCIVCKVEGREDEVQHAIDACPMKGSDSWELFVEGVEEVEKQMFKGKRFEDFSGCFGCGLPQRICQAWEVADDDGRRFRKIYGRECQYGGLLVGIHVGLRIQMGEEWADEILGMMKTDGVDIGDGFTTGSIYKWLGGLVEWRGMQTNRMCRVIYILSRKRIRV